MKATLTQVELDQMACGPTCHHAELVILGNCHPEAGTTLNYDRTTHVLVVRCWECDGEIMRIAVAEGAVH